MGGELRVDPADAGGPRLFDRHLGGAFHVEVAHAVVAVQLGGGSMLVQQEPDAEGEGIEYHYGVDFHELGAEDRMKIKSLVYQTIIEQPRRII